MQKLFILCGIVLILVGVAWPILNRLRIGRLPGDIIIKKSGFFLYFPLMTSIIVSLIISIILYLIRK